MIDAKVETGQVPQKAVLATKWLIFLMAAYYGILLTYTISTDRKMMSYQTAYHTAAATTSYCCCCCCHRYYYYYWSPNNSSSSNTNTTTTTTTNNNNNKAYYLVPIW